MGKEGKKRGKHEMRKIKKGTTAVKKGRKERKMDEKKHKKWYKNTGTKERTREE